MITENSIDQIRNADIFQVISHFVELRKAGANYKGLSPFANEKTPSFMVSPAKGIFKCFSSGNGGDAIKFVMLLKNVEFIEAVKIIAEICHITLEEEALTEDQVKHKNRRQSLYELTDKVASRYVNELRKQEPTHWAKKMLHERGYNEDILLDFQVGYAPADHNYLSKPLIEKALVSQAKSAGIIKVKDNRTYDFFYDRIIFPVQDERGRVVGYGGRRNNTEEAEKFPKYINSPESELFNKSTVLYGLFQAKQTISKERKAVLVEGYTDVISLHKAGCEIAVSTSGTALTKEQTKLLSRYTDTVVIFRDGDAAGKKAALRDIDICLASGLRTLVVLCPNGEDPDSLSRKQNINDFLNENAKDGVLWKAEELLVASANDPMAKASAIEQIAEMLAQLTNDISRNEYLKQVAKSAKVKQLEIKQAIDIIYEKAKQKLTAGNGQIKDAEILNLPEGASWEDFKNFRFVASGNAFYFQGKNGFFRGTNFLCTALFHIYGKSDNKRLCELINTDGQQRIIDFESKDFVNFTSFQEKCIDEGMFIFLPEVQTHHFKLMTQRVLKEFIMAYELKTLGWQQEKFFAFADGVYVDGQFKEVNKYGIIQVDVDGDESEYLDKVKHFYSPAFSEIYKHSRDDDDPYENDRAFVYKQSPVSIEKWMKQMCLVYGKKGNTAIAFAFASIFRDFIMSRYHFFPHLFLTGEKGSGKSKYGDSIASFFTYKLEPFDLNAGTLVGFYRRLARIKNIPTFLEEYHDKIDDRMFQSIKGSFDGRGREKGQATTDNRTVISKVNTSCIIAGQYLSSRDDNSLTIRSVIEHFIKPQEAFSDERIANYNALKSWEEQGLSSLILDVLKYRKIMEANFHKTFADLSVKLKNDLKNMDYEERMLGNYNALLSVIKVLLPYFEFPFTWEELYKQFKEAIIDTSDLITESEGLAEFWRVLPKLAKEGRIRDGHEFEITADTTVTVSPKRGVKQVFENTTHHKILYLRLPMVHQEYHNEVSRRDGSEVIGENTMRNYFKSKRYFIGPVSNRRFKHAMSSCYAFDYTMLNEQGILTLEQLPDRDEVTPAGALAGDNEDMSWLTGKN
tara:strand:- start:2913 stop:6146 length:3234 start_codon:yes stop_codon:yes gene_type:complete